MANLKVMVFGKKGCDKCSVLNQRLDKLLEKDEYKAFEKIYRDVETVEGLIDFCEAECLNPSKIPAMVVAKDMGDGKLAWLPNKTMGNNAAVYKKSKTHQYLGLQTDYSGVGKGIIAPKQIQATLEEALAMVMG
jgi:hypothetical protein